jgi:transposase InsO family protein
LIALSRPRWNQRGLASKPRQEETALRDEIQRLSLAQRKNGYRDGYRPITVQLQRIGWAVNHKRVARIRREDNLLCVPKKSFRPPTTDSRHHWHVWPNLARHLVPMAVNQLWVADITYIRMSEAFVYLAVVLDGFSRRVVGWAMADHLRAELALSALAMALGDRYVTKGELFHHSDQGVQYACGDYIARLERAGIQPSMSRAGCPRRGESLDRGVHRGRLQPAAFTFGAGLSGAGSIRGEPMRCIRLRAGVASSRRGPRGLIHKSFFMKRPRSEKERPFPRYSDPRPTSSPASSTPRYAASGLDLGLGSEGRHLVPLMPGFVLCVRQRPILSRKPMFAACGYGGRGGRLRGCA